MEKKVSIILPIYNQELYLERSLDAIIHQTYQNIEIVTVNDGSTDRSENIIIDYRKREPRIVYVKKSNGGLVDAVLVGVNASSGEYICFLDPDDYVGEDFVENFVHEIGDNDFIAMGFHYDMNGVISDGELESDRKLDRSQIDSLRKNYLYEKGNEFLSRAIHVARWNKMYSSKCIKQFIVDYARGGGV